MYGSCCVTFIDILFLILEALYFKNRLPMEQRGFFVSCLIRSPNFMLSFSVCKGFGSLLRVWKKFVFLSLFFRCPPFKISKFRPTSFWKGGHATLCFGLLFHTETFTIRDHVINYSWVDCRRGGLGGLKKRLKLNRNYPHRIHC